MLNTLLWNTTCLQEMDFFRIQYQNFEFKPHFHHHYVIQLVLSGVNEGERERKKYSVRPGKLLVINPGETHTGRVAKDQRLDYLGLYPTADFFHRYLSDTTTLSESPVFKQTVISDSLLASKLKNLVCISSLSKDILEIQSAAMEFFGLLTDRYTTDKPNDSPVGRENNRVNRAIRFIEENYNRTFPLSELSDVVALSPWHFTRIFRQQVGLTPFEYLRNVRVEKAKRLLANKHSLMDTSYLAGFYDQSHFNRHFKTITGFTPGFFLSRQI